MDACRSVGSSTNSCHVYRFHHQWILFIVFFTIMKTESGIRVKKLFWWAKCVKHGFKILKSIDTWDINLEALLLNKNFF